MNDKKNDKVLSSCVDHIHSDAIDRDDMPSVKQIMIILTFKRHEGTLTKVSLLAYIVSLTNKVATFFI